MVKKFNDKCGNCGDFLIYDRKQKKYKHYSTLVEECEGFKGISRVAIPITPVGGK